MKYPHKESATLEFKRDVPNKKQTMLKTVIGFANTYGGQHEWREKYDKSRTEFLELQGFEVIRYWNNQVSAQLDAVLTDIYEQVRRRL